MGLGFFRNAVAYIFLLMIGNFQHSIPSYSLASFGGCCKTHKQKKASIKSPFVKI